MIRITENLVLEIIHDLQRPHSFASERVGFIFTRLGTGLQPMALAKRYRPVADDHYINDPSVGAAINEHAIRSARQESFSSGDGIFHVHLHPWNGDPGISQIDLDGYRAMVPSFVPMAPSTAHGAIIFSFDNAIGLVRWPNSQNIQRSPICVVGFPMKFFGEL